MDLHDGDTVSYHYRSGGGRGVIVGEYHKGKTEATTGFTIRPDKSDRHPGEPGTIHRTGAHLREA